MWCGYNWQGGATLLVLLWSWVACHGLRLVPCACSATEINKEYIVGGAGAPVWLLKEGLTPLRWHLQREWGCKAAMKESPLADLDSALQDRTPWNIAMLILPISRLCRRSFCPSWVVSIMFSFAFINADWCAFWRKICVWVCHRQWCSYTLHLPGIFLPDYSQACLAHLALPWITVICFETLTCVVWVFLVTPL